jgi:O-acetyl-ADP-ribose deacetylase
LPAKYVIHTVGPVWSGGKKGEPQKLSNCYRNSLQLAADHSCKSVAFPAISTGVYGYPAREAAKIAVETVMDFLQKDDKIEKVVFICFNEENYNFVKEQLNQKGL